MDNSNSDFEIDQKREHQLLDAICRAQEHFIANEVYKSIFDGLLDDLLQLTESTFGFLGEVLADQVHQTYVKIHAFNNMSSNASTQSLEVDQSMSEREFHDWNEQFGSALTTLKPVISNSPPIDPCGVGFPQGYPEVQTLLGIPILHGNHLVAMIGLANRPLGYDSRFVNFLQPIVVTIAQLIDARRTAVDRQRLMNRLRASEQLLNETGALARVGGWRLDLTTMQLEWTDETRRIHEVESDFIPTVETAIEFYTPETRQFIRHIIDMAVCEGRGFDLDLNLISAKGNSKWVRSVGRVEFQAQRAAFLYGACQDITSRVKIERQAVHVQRLEAIGTLAGGIAHDLNNALAPILMGLELLRPSCNDENGLLETMETSAMCASGMVRQLLMFAKGSDGEQVRLQANSLITEVEKIVRGTFPRNIEIVTSVAEELPEVIGNRTQLHQVLLNLCVNARDAMPRGGTLSMSTLLADVNDENVKLSLGGSVGRFVAFRVQDTGSGIDPHIMNRIFEPFFTTKESDQASGLGLSTAHGIVRSHRGFLQVESKQGTLFTFYLPWVGNGAAVSISGYSNAPARGDMQKVLIVDDEPLIRDVLRQLLPIVNFVPIIAGGPKEGLVLAATYARELQAVITDMHMPSMDGIEFIIALRKILPNVPIIVSSGRIDPHQAKNLEALGIAWRLDKPFTAAALTDCLNRAIQSSVGT